MDLPRTLTNTWLAALAAALVLTSTLRSADDDTLKQEVLKMNSVTGIEAINAKVGELLKDKAGVDKKLKVAEALVKANPKSFQYNGAAIWARTAFGQKKYELSLTFYKLCMEMATKVQSSSKLIEAFDGQYFTLQELKKYDEAEKLCQKFLEMDVDEELEKMKPFIMEQMIQAKARQGKIDDALKLTESLVKLDDGGWYFLRLKGWVLHEAGKLDEAVTAYLETIKKLEKADRLKPAEQERWADRTRYVLSGLYVEMKQIDKAAEQLQILLKKKPDSPTYNNDLGFIWADHDKNLDESEKLVRKAIDEDRKQRKEKKDKGELMPEEDKDHAAYLDSLGWVLFKKKQYAEAKKWLLDATKDADEGQHVEILDHLADVHMALGEKKEAIAVWKKALEQDISTKRDLKRQEEVRKKLKDAESK